MNETTNPQTMFEDLSKSIASSMATELYAPKVRFSLDVDTFSIEGRSQDGVKLFVLRIPVREMIGHIELWKFAIDQYKEVFTPVEDEETQKKFEDLHQRLTKKFSSASGK